jgi:hypothetical protein
MTGVGVGGNGVAVMVGGVAHAETTIKLSKTTWKALTKDRMAGSPE